MQPDLAVVANPSEGLLAARVDAEALQDRRRGTRDLDSACDVMQQGIVLLDRDCQITYANGAAAVCMRVPREQLWFELGIEAAWIVFFVLTARVMYRRGLRRYSGFGG